MAQQLEIRNGIKGGYWLATLADQLPSESIPDTYTHLFYASVLPDAANNYELKITGTQTDHDKLMRDFTDVLQRRMPQQMSFLSIGGRLEIPRPANSLADTFSRMASREENRKAFIRNSISVARDYGFDGLDLDWEFPNNPTDMNNLSLLFSEWRAAIEEEYRRQPQTQPRKPRLLLSAAVYFASNFFLDKIRRAYDVPAINDNVDFVLPRCYDYHSGDTTKTSAHACLHDPSNPRLNTGHGISTWIAAGLNPRKLVMGLPLYGRTWKLRNSTKHEIGDIADGTGPGNGFMTYQDIVSFNATPVYDCQTVSAYSYSGTDWIGYDNEESIQEKVRYAKAQRLGGYFFWALQYGKDGILAKAASAEWET